MTRPDFSGRWRFLPGASLLQIDTPDAVLLSIDHRDPVFRLERTLTFGDRSDSFAIDLTVGGQPEPIARGAAVLYPALEWDGDHLLFITRIVGGPDPAINRVRYRLEQDGAILVAEESFRGLERDYDNRWTFVRDPGGPG